MDTGRDGCGFLFDRAVDAGRKELLLATEGKLAVTGAGRDGCGFFKGMAANVLFSHPYITRVRRIYAYARARV